jgi:hypothetical protein
MRIVISLTKSTLLTHSDYCVSILAGKLVGKPRQGGFDHRRITPGPATGRGDSCDHPLLAAILQDNRQALDEGAAALLAHETLGAEELPKVKMVAVG